MGANLRSKGQRSRSQGRKCKNRFSHTFVKSGSIYVKSRTKWSVAHSAYIVKYISSAEKLPFCDNL